MNENTSFCRFCGQAIYDTDDNPRVNEIFGEDEGK